MNDMTRDLTTKPSAVYKYDRSEYQAVARMITFALVQDTTEDWKQLSESLAEKLSLADRLSVAAAAIGGLTDDARLILADGILADLAPDRGAGAPQPTFLDIAAEAEGWAAFATRAERRAYFFAIWRAMPATDQAEFRRFIKKDGSDA